MNTKVIAIAGGSGSGKSYLARSLGNFYPKEDILIIEQDSYYKDISHMDYENRCNQNFDHPNAIDSILIKDHLKKFLSGKSVSIPNYNFIEHLREKVDQKIKPCPIIIIEGILMLYYTSLHKFFSLKIYIDTPEPIRFSRRIKRDVRFRGRTPESIKKQYFSTVKPMHEKFVQPTKSYSDIVLKGTDLKDKSIKQIKSRIDLI